MINNKGRNGKRYLETAIMYYYSIITSEILSNYKSYISTYILHTYINYVIVFVIGRKKAELLLTI